MGHWTCFDETLREIHTPNAFQTMWRCPKMRVPSNHPRLDHFGIETHGVGDLQF